ncbi:MAG: phosphoenolpyruvate carboxylase [Cyclobacteriaceae bacterium]|jgi:phosphoenolpyruvate carboxylase|nr:phosphoenolpyruvate carboxylase [Cyclobacteriaceae bacterium]
MTTQYEQAVGARYHIYNSLFLNLPFRHVSRTGTLLPLLQQYCGDGFEKGEPATQIIDQFFGELAPQASREEQFDLLFNFIQYVERQVALFDSVEDSAFELVNDVRGRGTVDALLMRTRLEAKEEALLQRLNQLSIRIVLTAHPTQFYPGHVLGILTDLEQSIRTNDIPQINALLRQLGKTGFINKDKPTPYDEAVSLCWFLENVFYPSIAQILRTLSQGLGIAVSEWPNPRLLTIGFWPGGDRDGNPFVTTDITLRVAAKLRESILKCYHRDLRVLRRRLTFQGVHAKVIAIEQTVYNMAYAHAAGYATPEELVRDLGEVRTLLLQEHEGLFLEMLDDLLIKLRAFGFHFASLDIRQDSRKHELVWKHINAALAKQNKGIDWAAFEKADSRQQIDTLLSISANPVFLSLDDPLAEETIRSLVAIKTIQAQNGALGCHRYVISNCQKAAHVIQVFQLALVLIGEKQKLPLDIVPLFETIDDLARAAAVMEELYQVPAYRAHVRTRGDRQTIMLGFSDGTKDGGYLRANWSIFRAKEQLTALSRQHGITVIFFDGRGGPPARGGGNTHDFYASLGDTIENQEVHITIQGQTISSNFGKIASCTFNLEQLLSAGVEGAVFPKKDAHLSEDDKALLDELAEEGYRAYLDLKHHPKFVPYLEKVTPLSFFGDTNIGSRPVKRNAGEGLRFEDLRAIPFVGSWAMMKQNIPGFYGVGSALQALTSRGQEAKLKALYQRSLFFRTLLGNSMMSLSKTYYPATAYLGSDAEFGDFWKKMFAEYELSRQQVLGVSGLAELMGNNPSIQSSVRLRERIVLPLIAIQQYALMHLRQAREADKPFELRYRKLVIRCMFGIINAARNSA